jgi:hypothetical protein
MKNFILGIIVCLGLTVLATVGIGDKITAKKFNNSTFQIGDIKQSMLHNDEFVAIHGDCWEQMNNNIPLSGTDLGNHIINIGVRSYTQIPDASGRVLRSEGGLSSSLGATQEDAFQGHQHATTYTSSGSNDYAGSNGAIYSGTTTIGRFTVDAIRQDLLYYQDPFVGEDPRVANETRSKNLTVNMFVKINNDCN